MIKIEILPGDFHELYTFYFAASLEGKSTSQVFNRMFEKLDKQARKFYASSYTFEVDRLRKEIAKQRKS